MKRRSLLTKILPVWLVAICIIFQVAGVRKLSDPGAFERALRSQDVLPSVLIPAAVRIVPFAECFLGAGLAVAVVRRSWRTRAAIVTLAVLGGFSTYLVAVWLLPGAHEACGCGVVAHQQASTALMKNALLMGVTIIAAWGSGTSRIGRRPQTGTIMFG